MRKSLFIFAFFFLFTVLLSQPDQGRRIDFNRQHAFFIGIKDYNHIGSLNNTVNDCLAIKSLLKEKYGYKEKNIKTLFGSQAGIDEINEHLGHYLTNLVWEDSLFVYFSGHGFKDKTGKGYWLPSDVGRDLRGIGYYNQNDDSNSIPIILESKFKIKHSDVMAFMKNCKAKHIFVLADSCYSAVFFEECKGPSQFYPSPHLWDWEKKSRQLLASGEYEVSDGIHGKNSPFARGIIDIMDKGSLSDGCMSASDIISEVTRRFQNNLTGFQEYSQEPMGKRVYCAGDNEGQYYFCLKIDEIRDKFEKVKEFMSNVKTTVEEKQSARRNFLEELAQLPGEFERAYRIEINWMRDELVDIEASYGYFYDDEHNLVWMKDNGDFVVFERKDGSQSVFSLLEEMGDEHENWRLAGKKEFEILRKDKKLFKAVGANYGCWYWSREKEGTFYRTYRFERNRKGKIDLKKGKRRSSDGASYIFVMDLTDP